MNTIKNYQTYTNKTIDKSSCVEIQLGKQRKKRFKETSIFFNSDDFLLLEQTIWDNYREYSPDSVVKIQTEEWVKIIRGIKELRKLLQNPVYNDELISNLNIKSFDKEFYKENYLLINKNIDKMLNSFIEWIEPNLQNDEYISITG